MNERDAVETLPTEHVLEESEPVPTTTITLVKGASFAICSAEGGISHGVEGLYVGDARICSRLTLTIDDREVEPLAVAARSPSSASFVARTRDRRFLVFRDAWVGLGMRMDLRVRNVDVEPRRVTARIGVAADLAGLFDVKRGGPSPPTAPGSADGERLWFARDGHGERGLVVRAAGSVAEADGLSWTVEIAPGEAWQACVQLTALRGGNEVHPIYPCDRAPHAAPVSIRQRAWRARLPEVTSDVAGLADTLARTRDDIGALQLVDRDHPDELLVAAGAPWYMTLFGRDSIFTSWMALLLDPALALGTARTLARLQGRDEDPRTEEQPGRILHEVRFARGPSLALADGDIYYGTADATPLFVMLVHELWRWGVPWVELLDLMPAVDAALEWIDGPGDPDGDGFVEYAPSPPASLTNQGWKDSRDGISFADGRLPQGSVALAEVQAYAYAAWRGGAELAAFAGDPSTAEVRHRRAEALRGRFERDFWVEERDAFAIALDGDKRAVDAVASNIGHCLWTGIVADRAKAEAVARWLASPELFSGWGVRTLGTSMARYNPVSYHNGSVWPHDTAVCIAGLRRYGFDEHVDRLSRGLLAAAEHHGGRLPELFAGLTPDDVPVPVRYPTSCSPQAWSSAAPLLVLRSLLGLEPDVPAGLVQLDPLLPQGSRSIQITGLPLAGERLTIEVDGDATAVRGLPRGLALLRPAD